MRYKKNFFNMNIKKNFCSKNNIPAEKTIFKKFVFKIKAFFNKRILLFRIMFYSSFILIGISLMRYNNNINYAKNITPIYFLQNSCSENNFYNVAGVVKPNSININKGTDELNFIITDYQHELTVYYKGVIPPNFLEGNTVISTGSITDRKKPNILIANKIMTDHGYNSDTWLNRQLESNNKDRQIIIDEMINKNLKTNMNKI